MRKRFFTIFALALFFISCDDNEKINHDGLTENNVDISGSWSLANVTQNNIDITDQFDFESLGLTFTYDGNAPSSFSLTGASNIPFAFSMTDGTLSFDDLIYPTELTFSGSQNVSFKLAELPLVSKGDDMKLEVVLGCSENTYVYSFKKK